MIKCIDLANEHVVMQTPYYVQQVFLWLKKGRKNTKQEKRYEKTMYLSKSKCYRSSGKVSEFAKSHKMW